MNNVNFIPVMSGLIFYDCNKSAAPHYTYPIVDNFAVVGRFSRAMQTGCKRETGRKMRSQPPKAQ